MICPNCKDDCPDGARFCPHCGRSLEPSTCRKCGGEVGPGFKYCPECGSQVKPVVASSITEKQKGQNKHIFGNQFFSFRRVGSILTLLWCLFYIVLFVVSGRSGVDISWGVVFIFVIPVCCSIVGLNTRLRTPAVILILDLLVLLIWTLAAAIQGNNYTRWYNEVSGLPSNYMVMSLDGIVITYLILLIPAFMMLITPRKYKNQIADSEKVEDSSDGTTYVSGYVSSEDIPDITQEEDSGFELKQEEPQEDEWKCPKCGTNNKVFTIACRKCGCDKPKSI